MPVVFIHGVPDTARVWEPLITLLGRDDLAAVRLPGFGCPRPEGFDATKEAYVNWLVEQISGLDGPIDLVGHDWGCILTLRLASLRIPNLRSWACGNAPIDRTYVWHDTAQLWQTPDVGEQVMADFITPDVMRTVFESEGMSPELAAAEAGDIDDTMKGCILDLYRSAITVGDDWEDGLDDIEAPGLVLWADNDPYVPFEFGERLAARTGARLVRLECSHWWPTMRTGQVAGELTTFWSTLT